MDQPIRIFIANDHGGLDLKNEILRYCQSRNLECVDFGSSNREIVRYPLYAIEVAKQVRESPSNRGVLICSTGIGMSVIANKIPGIRAALCTSTHMAKMTRAHNDSNILCLGGKIVSPSLALEMLDVWLSQSYEGGRHDISLNLIREAEQQLYRPGATWTPAITAALKDALPAESLRPESQS